MTILSQVFRKNTSTRLLKINDFLIERAIETFFSQYIPQLQFKSFPSPRHYYYEFERYFCRTIGVTEISFKYYNYANEGIFYHLSFGGEIVFNHFRYYFEVEVSRLKGEGVAADTPPKIHYKIQGC